MLKGFHGASLRLEEIVVMSPRHLIRLLTVASRTDLDPAAQDRPQLVVRTFLRRLVKLNSVAVRQRGASTQPLGVFSLVSEELIRLGDEERRTEFLHGRLGWMVRQVLDGGLDGFDVVVLLGHGSPLALGLVARTMR